VAETYNPENRISRSGISSADDSALRRALLTRDQLAVLFLHWRFQPALDVENHPLFLGVFLHRPYQQILRDVVEEALDVQIQNPVIAPASLPCLVPTGNFELNENMGFASAL
jgi:hypothetical protein